MSWEEYKRKKKQLSEEDIGISTEDSSKLSSWEKFKQEKEKAKANIVTTKKEEDTDSWFKSGAFNDGYQFGDLTKTTLGTVGDVGVGLVKGAGSLVEGVGDLVTYGAADVVGLFGNENKANQMRTNARKSTVDELFSPLESVVDKNSVLGDKSDSIVEGLGYVAAVTAISIATAGAGTALGASGTTAATIGSTTATFTSAMGNSMSEALNDGASLEEARIYGIISGAAEAGSELMFGGLGKASKAMGLSTGAFDDVVIGGLTKDIKNKMTKTIIQSGLKAGAEGFEEVVSGFISAIGKKATYMKEKKFKEIFSNEKLGEQFWMGALTSAIAQGPSTMSSIRHGTDYITGRTDNEQKVYDRELKTRTEEKIREATIEQAYNEQIKTQENLGVKLTEEAKAEIMQKVEKAYDNGKLKSNELSKKDLTKIQEEVEADMEEGNISVDTIMNTLGENQDISKDRLLQRSMYENEQRYNSYNVEQTDNEKVNVLMQSAADAGMNNTSKTRKRVELISKLVKDTDRQYKFASPEQLKEMGYNENANGLIDKSTGEILINSHSKGIQAIVGHETTHIFDSKNEKGEYSKEYLNLQDMAIEYAKAKGIYDSKVQSITKAYGTLLTDESQIKEELTADLVGDFLFNDSKFIENLAVKDRNIFQKIYDYIKHAYKVATAGTEEAKALENLKYQFEKVYKTISEETNTDTKYSIAGKKAIENIKGTKFYKEAEENLKLAKQLKEEGKNNLTLLKKTGWFQDQAGDWKFEFSDKNMELKKKNFALNKEYNLSEVLEHDELFYFYPELANYTVIFKNKSNSSYSAEDKTISLAYKKIGDSEKLKGTLIHEIQHAIQHIENYAHGTSAKLGLMRYYNTLGEIEAADTKERYLNTFEGKKNTILPETAKENPTHPKIKNGDILYKIANGVYNFFHGGEKNVYKNKNSLEQNYERNKTLVDERGRIKYSLKESEINSGSFSMQDNKGRLITKEQQEYFKDSKVKDENGNLITVYHGTTKAGFTEFSGGNRGVNYYTDNEKVAQSYIDLYRSSHETNKKNGVYEGYANITNPLEIDVQNRKWSEIRRDFISDIDILELIDADLERKYNIFSTTDVVIAAKKSGKYDGVIFKNIYDNATSTKEDLSTVYATFNSNQFKNVNNTKPTSDRDIRYSLSKDNQGRTLTKEQQEYFKDSKVRDKEGRLIEVYHGTPAGKFNIYDNSKLGITSNARDSKLGIHLTDNIDLANQFKDYASGTIRAKAKEETYKKYNIEYNLVPFEMRAKIEQEITKLAEQMVKENGEVKKQYIDIQKPFSIFSKYGISEEQLANDLVYALTGSKEISDTTDYYETNIEFLETIQQNFNNEMAEMKDELAKYESIERLKELGYDGVILPLQTTDKLGLAELNLNATGNEYIVFNSNQIKNVDNINPTDNSDIRLSMTDDTRITGDDIATRDMLKKEKPTIEDEVGNTEELSSKEKLGSNVDKYNQYKQKILKSKEIEVNNLIKNKNAAINELEKQIAEKEKLLNSKKDKTTKVANDLKMQIENLKQRKIKIENEYNSRIDRKNERVTKEKIKLETKKKLGLTRKQIKEQLLAEMNIEEKDISVGEDIASLNYQITDPIRVNEKVFGKEIGNKINEATIKKTKHNTAEKIRWQNKERQEILSLGIKARSKESAAVQKYGEKKYVDEFGDSHEYGDTELAREFKDIEVQKKIKHAAAVIREKYDQYIDLANEILTGLGYDEIHKREDYMRHFQELTDKFSQVGVPLNLNDLKANDLPTDINGLTEFNKPGKAWFASEMQRTGIRTTYDAITGIDGYIEGIGNTIFHTEDIQNYRALSSLIRDTYGQKHGLDNVENMSDEEVATRIQDIQDNKLTKYVAWLDEQANSLSGKKGAIDRGIERALGRRIYTVLNTAKKQVGSNMTGYNVRSCLTNLISSVIASSKTNKIAFVKGTVSTINNMFKKDDFIEKSDFLTSRFGSDMLSQKFWQKVSNNGQIFMKGTDWFTSNQIVRSKYYEGLSKNMTEKEAIKYADDFAARVMGDRSQGATAEIFNSKTLGLLTQFQLEVNNQWQFMLHDTKMDYQQNKEDNKGLEAGAIAVFQMGQMAAYSYFFNELFEKLTGTRAAFDPIEIFKTLFGADEDDEEKTFDDRLSEAGGLLIDNIPFGNLFTDGGRIPVSEAFEGVGTLFKKVTGQTDDYGNELTWEDVGKSFAETIPYWVLPTGYSQAKKTIKGLDMFSADKPVAGSYTDKGDLRYTVEDNVGSRMQSAIFGAYANPYSQDYIESGFKTIKKENIEEMIGLDMNSTEYREFKKNLSNVSNTSDKNGYKQYKDENNNTYWYDDDAEIMYDSKYKKTTLTEDDLIKVSKKEEALNYIDSLDLTDSQKNLVANNMNKSAKKKINMSDYSNYSSYEEYTYARDYPKKYSVISNIDTYDKYQEYQDEITEIKKAYSTESGYTSKQRKEAVQSYINDLDLNMYQKIMLERMAGGYSIKNYKNYIYEYLESLDLTNDEKYVIWEELFN